MSISIDEMAAIVKRIDRHWPGCLVGRPQGTGYHEVRTKDGALIVAHEDLGDCLRAADALAKSKGAK